MLVATFSSVTRHNVLQAIAEYDERGSEEFLDLYGFEPVLGYALVHEGHSYDSRAVLGVAHRFATGRLATAEEFHGGMQDAVMILRKRGFEVTVPASAPRPVPVKATRTRTPAARTTTTRSTAAREAPAAICPTCLMTLPATGICDDCG